MIPVFPYPHETPSAIWTIEFLVLDIISVDESSYFLNVHINKLFEECVFMYDTQVWTMNYLLSNQLIKWMNIEDERPISILLTKQHTERQLSFKKIEE